MTDHEQFADDLALHALNALEGEDRVKLEKHLATCSACRLELEQLRGDGALLALSTLGPKPPLRARQRLLDAVAKEAAASATRRRAQQNAREIGHASALLVGMVGMGGDCGGRRVRGVVVERKFRAENKVWLRPARRRHRPRANSTICGGLPRPSSRRRRSAFHGRGDEDSAPAAGQGVLSAQSQQSGFRGQQHAALPPHKAYELWLIPAQGVPVAAGVFKPDAHGSATVVNPPLPAGLEAKGFAITVEDEAGVEHSTQPVMMIGIGE
jgi:hypothetical protein